MSGWPSTFLLDRAGRIRYRGLRGKDLQIAHELGKSEGAVRTTLSRALVRLSALLDEEKA